MQMAHLHSIQKTTGLRTIFCLLWLATALSSEAKSLQTKTAVHWWAKGGYRQPRWRFPCQSPETLEQQEVLRENELLFTLADHYQQIFENAIRLRLKVKDLMERYEKQHVQDTLIVQMLRSRYNPFPCLVSAQEKIPISFEQDEDLVIDKGLVDTLTAFSKMAKYVSYFDVTTKMYFEDGGQIINSETIQQNHVTENIYTLLCDLHAVIQRRHQKIPGFLVNDVISAEDCLADQNYDISTRYIRDFAILSNFDKILKVVVEQFEELYRLTKK